jgi:hypothetical protein
MTVSNVKINGGAAKSPQVPVGKNTEIAAFSF